MFARGGDSAASVAQRNYTLWGRLFESRPNDVNVLIPYAQFLNEQDDNEKSEEMFKRCLEIDKNDVKGLLGFAKLLEEQDRHGEACGLYERAFELDVKRAELATNDSRYGPLLCRQHKFFQVDPEDMRNRGLDPCTVPSQEEAEATLCLRCRKGGPDLKRCVRCKQVRYCGTECQKAHWKQHKKVCTPA
mmetsp:Transcript_64481/g.97178  ORF Transcript_64481/g.97178 Transcript_64481/m.97178 type:complete len:189 (-) Transcript_64481:114-680(-)